MEAFSKNQDEPIPCSSVETSLDFNNCLARQLALSATSVPCPLSRYAKQQYIAKQNIREIHLNDGKRFRCFSVRILYLKNNNSMEKKFVFLF